MMAAASPRFKKRHKPDRTVHRPRGRAFCFPIWEISSMRHRGNNLLLGFERPFGHLRHAVVRANALRAALPQLGALRWGLPEAVNGVGEPDSVVGVCFDSHR